MSLGELSDTLVWGAATAYAVAFVAFAIDLARLADARAVVAQERALAKVGERVEWPEGMYVPGGAVAA